MLSSLAAHSGSCRFTHQPLSFALTRLLVFSLAAAAITLNAGCGGGSSAPPLALPPPPPSPTITSVAITCSPSTIQVNQTSKCTSTVAGTGNFDATVTWSVDNGMIDADGNYTAPASPAMATVKATSKQDPTKSGVSTITVQAPGPTITSVTVSCNPSTVQFGQTSVCSATVQGTGNFDASVTWSVDIGSISSSGVFTAPNSAGTATVKGTSVQDPTKAGDASVVIAMPPNTLTVSSSNPTSGVLITASPADNSGQNNGNTQFTLTYNSGTIVTLTAPASAAGNTFSGWTGCDSASGTACTVTMNADRAVTASYAPQAGFVFVANEFSNDLSAYKLDPVSGALTPNGTIATGFGPDSVIADPSGRCLYAANSGDSSALLSVFAINPDGTLSAKPPVPVNVFTSEAFPTSIAMHPTGQFVYVANQAGTISAFTLDTATCTLTRIANSPFAAGTLPQFATIDPSGNFLYVVNLGDNTISAYKIDAVTGALTPITGPPFPAGNAPTSLTIHPSGKFAFATSSFDNSVLAYTRDPATGLLTQPTPFATGGGSFSAAVHPTRNFLFLAYLNGANTPGAVEVYAIDPTTGNLTSAGVFATGTTPMSVTVDQSGNFLYVANNGSTSVSAFQIDLNTGALTPISPGSFQAGGGPVSVTTTAPKP